MAYKFVMMIRVQFVETPLFTDQVTAHLTDEQYSELQAFLAENPEAGVVIRQTGGLRKLRWADPASGRGKRGGNRVIYYYRSSHEQIFMLMMYGKSEQTDLNHTQKKQLAEIVNTWR